MTLTEIIKPIVLLRGPHSNTDKTGRGCFMDVIAYLNGEPQITDNSECVCFVVRPIAIWLNDHLTDGERMRMLPYIECAMGSRTDDRAEYVRRTHLAATMARTCNEIAASAAANASSTPTWWTEKVSAAEGASAAANAAARAAYAAEAAAYAAWAAWAESAVLWATAAAVWATKAAGSAVWTVWTAMNGAENRQQITEACFAFLDAALPATITHNPIVAARAKTLVALAVE